jgi:broad specificity phosphatase PhoE
MSVETTLLLARHGETEWNRVGRWQGHADPPLSDAGREQAAMLALRLADAGVTAVVSSDLRRASETADIVAGALGLALDVDPELREIDVGSWSGHTREEVAALFPEGYARWQEGEIGHDGETREQLTARVVAAVERACAAHSGGTVLVVTHGGAIRALLRHVTGDPGGQIANCDVVPLAVVAGALVAPTR